MRKSNHYGIRMVLQKYPDGLTISDIAERLEKDRGAINRALPQMPDAYIDRWTACKSQLAAVWCVIVPPENCPKPIKKTVKRKEMNGYAEFRSLVQ